MFGEGKHTELEEVKLKEAAMEKPMVTRDTISDTSPHKARLGRLKKHPTVLGI